VFVDGTTLPPAHNRGALVHVWCDDPNAKTEAEIATALYPRLRVLAQHTWGSPKPAPLYLMFQSLINAVGPAPT
jgi:hexosaminidase